jgi:hypothetical protein
MRKSKFPTEHVIDRRGKAEAQDKGSPDTKSNRGLPDTKSKRGLPDSLLDFSPALQSKDLVDLEQTLAAATPEQFQQLLAMAFRKIMVKGLRDIPAPKSIKELQAVYDMFRKAEGIEAKDRGGSGVGSGFLPRVVGRKRVVDVEDATGEVAETVDAEVMMAETVDAEVAEITDTPTTDTTMADTTTTDTTMADTTTTDTTTTDTTTTDTPTTDTTTTDTPTTDTTTTDTPTTDSSDGFF